jgi:nucleolar protein 56
MLDGAVLKATIVESVMGVFGFGKNNRLVEKAMFPTDAVEAAKSLLKIEEGVLVEEISGLIDGLMTKGYKSFVFENSKIAKSIGEKFNSKVAVVNSSKAGRWLRGNLEQLALDLGFVKKPEQLRAFIHEVSIELAKIKVKKTVQQRDFLASQAIQMLDDLDRSLNLFMSRLREWFGLHYPELDRQVDKHETYARLVAKLGTKDNFTVKILESEGLPKAKANSIAKVAAASMGADLCAEDLVQIQDVARKVLEIYGVRDKLEEYVDTIMEDVAPNTRVVAGSLLGARLLAHAGGLMNLAKLPASTIQVMGAEKALFRSLKSKARPPKHGIIFQHPLVHDAKRWQRGKVARALAGKLSIAARVDAFKGDFVGDRLNMDLEKRIKEVKERYHKPPQGSPTKKSISKKKSDQKSGRRKKRGSKR